MPGIFISYRREDSAGETRGIYDRLRGHFGAEQVFRDLEGIEPGVDFVEQIEKEIAGCAAVLVVIGPRWLTISASNGTPRLSESDDPVRIEVAAALNRPGLKVIPVLVDGAKMPEPEALPDGLTTLPRRAGIEITDARFDFDTGKLIDALERAVRPAAEHAPSPAQRLQSLVPSGADARWRALQPDKQPFSAAEVTEYRHVPFGIQDVFRHCVQSVQVLDDARVERADHARFAVVLRVGRSLVSWGERVTIQLTANGDGETRARLTSVAVEPPAGVSGIQGLTQRFSAARLPKQHLLESRNRENVERIAGWLDRLAPAQELQQADTAPAGWYVDGDDQMLRWWNGHAWTAHQAPPLVIGSGQGDVTVRGPEVSSAGSADDAGAGWYDDPSDTLLLRWWDGSQWTASTVARPQ